MNVRSRLQMEQELSVPVSEHSPPTPSPREFGHPAGLPTVWGDHASQRQGPLKSQSPKHSRGQSSNRRTASLSTAQDRRGPLGPDLAPWLLTLRQEVCFSLLHAALKAGPVAPCSYLPPPGISFRKQWKLMGSTIPFAESWPAALRCPKPDGCLPVTYSLHAAAPSSLWGHLFAHTSPAQGNLGAPQVRLFL